MEITYATREIDGSLNSNANLMFYYNVTKYPTVILVMPKRNVEYVGDRSGQNLYQFVERSISDH